MHNPTDPLSPTARHLLKLNLNAYRALVLGLPGSIKAKDPLVTEKPAQPLAAGTRHRPWPAWGGLELKRYITNTSEEPRHANKSRRPV